MLIFLLLSSILFGIYKSRDTIFFLDLGAVYICNTYFKLINIMKKKKLKLANELSIDKFRVAELKNPKIIIGGRNEEDNGGIVTADPARKR